MNTFQHFRCWAGVAIKGATGLFPHDTIFTKSQLSGERSDIESIDDCLFVHSFDYIIAGVAQPSVACVNIGRLVEGMCCEC